MQKVTASLQLKYKTGLQSKYRALLKLICLSVLAYEFMLFLLSHFCKEVTISVKM